MTNEVYYHGGLNFSPVAKETEVQLAQKVADIFGEDGPESDIIYVDFDDSDNPSIVFEGYFEPDNDALAKHIKEADSFLRENGSCITGCVLEANNGFCKVGEVIMENREPVFLDIEAAAIHNASNDELLGELKKRGASISDATDQELMDELKRRGKDYARLVGIAKDFIDIEAESAEPDFLREIFVDMIGISEEEAEQLGLDTNLLFEDEEV